MLLASVPQLCFKSVSACSYFAIVHILLVLHCHDGSVNIDIISLRRSDSLSCRKLLISSVCACKTVHIVCFCVHVCVSVCVHVCTPTAELSARTGGISLIKQVLKRQKKVPLFVPERITVIIQHQSQARPGHQVT